MRISIMMEAIENASRGGGVTAKNLSEMSGASVRECRETVRELHAAGILNRHGNAYYLNTQSTSLETIIRCVVNAKANKRHG